MLERLIVNERFKPLQLSIIQGNILQQRVDAIVNPTDEILSGGGGLDAKIHQAAGSQLRQALNKFQICETGEAIITPGFNLPAKYIIHAVGPIYRDGKQGEAELLAQCYRSILKLARDNNLNSLAVPAISTGVFRYPTKDAAKVVHDTVYQYLEKSSFGSLQEIRFVLWDKKKFNIYKQAFFK